MWYLHTYAYIDITKHDIKRIPKDILSTNEYINIHSPNLINQLPYSFIGPKVLPLHFNFLYFLISEHELFLLQNALCQRLEFSLSFHLQYRPINHMINIFHIYIKQWNMENNTDFQCWCQCKSVGHWSNLSRISKASQYRGANLTHDPILKDILLGLMHKYTCYPTWNSLNSLWWYAQLFCLSCVAFKFLLIAWISCSISTNMFGPINTLFIGSL